MHILMLVAHPNIRGPLPKLTPMLVNALRELGCEVITEPWGRQSDEETAVRKIGERFRDVLRIREHLQTQSFDAMVVNTSHGWSGLTRDIVLLLATRNKCPKIILQFHGSQSNKLGHGGNFFFRLLTDWLVRMCDAILLLSSEEKRELEAIYPTRKFLVVNNPFLPPLRQDGQVEFEGLLPQECSILLYVGRLIKGKGIFDLVDAMPSVLERMPCHLLVAGSGEDEQQMREHIERLGLCDSVTLVGYLTGNRLWSIYQKADIFVLPTLWKEGFPTVLAEAMYSGLPIITTAIRGAADHLTEGVNALFVPPRDPHALADAMLCLLMNPALRAKMSQANREKVKVFSPEIVARHYLDALVAICQAH